MLDFPCEAAGPRLSDLGAPKCLANARNANIRANASWTRPRKEGFLKGDRNLLEAELATPR